MIRRNMMCRTIAGNRCDVLTITEPVGGRKTMGEAMLEQLGPGVPKALRIGIVFTARVHPGESNSSWIMDGLLRFITGDTVEAARLRANFVFKIVPMLNADGVINGNYRCGLAGHDLNRRYLETSPSFHPTIYYFKKMVARFKRERPLGLFVDVHGHSSKPNAFVYGCEAKLWRDWFAGYTQGPPLPYTELVFPTLLEERSSIFSMADSSFKLRKSKLTTGRAVLWRDGIANTFTLEASFGGATRGACAARHFGIQDLRNLGRDVCLAVRYTYTHSLTHVHAHMNVHMYMYIDIHTRIHIHIRMLM
jgi:cytosolic carboxypeptidase protein 2/3